MVDASLSVLCVSGIYQMLNTASGGFYIGSSVHIRNRLYKHLSFLRRGVHPNAHLQSAFSLYGEPAFSFHLIEPCDPADLLVREQHYLDTLRPSYNLCKVAGNTLGVLHGPEAKAKMSVANKGNSRRLGKSHTAETKVLIGLLAQQRSHSQAAKEKISQSLIGNTRTKGKSLSLEHKQKVAAASLSMWSGPDAEKRRADAAARVRMRWADPAWKAAQSEKIRLGKQASARPAHETAELAR